MSVHDFRCPSVAHGLLGASYEWTTLFNPSMQPSDSRNASFLMQFMLSYYLKIHLQRITLPLFPKLINDHQGVRATTMALTWACQAGSTISWMDLFCHCQAPQRRSATPTIYPHFRFWQKMQGQVQSIGARHQSCRRSKRALSCLVVCKS